MSNYLNIDRSGRLPLKNRDVGATNRNSFEKHDDEMGDEEEDLSLELRAAAQASAATTWPEERYAYVKLCYDRSLKGQLENDNTDFDTWADAVMTHVQSHYRHPSLPTKIQYKVQFYK